MIYGDLLFIFKNLRRHLPYKYHSEHLRYRTSSFNYAFQWVVYACLVGISSIKSVIKMKI